ncbi:hypothetical protein MKX01_039261 [Papaver californicum]|nr:hypothetical protein MKX01_039261 [Papaver californicum]
MVWSLNVPVLSSLSEGDELLERSQVFHDALELYKKQRTTVSRLKKKQYISRSEGFKEHKKIIGVTNLTKEKIERLRPRSIRITDRITWKSNKISSVPIHVSIYSRNVVNLTMIDLPDSFLPRPIIHFKFISSSFSPILVVQDTEDMVHIYVDKPISVVLAISPANQDLATFDAIKLAKNVDPQGDRTFGVLTKLDLMDKGTYAIEVLEGRSHRLKYLWFGVGNSSQSDINNNREYFSTSLYYGHLAHKIGSEYLVKLLSKHLESRKMNHLGRNLAVDGGAQLNTILEFCHAFDRIFQDHLDGGKHGGDRIYGVFDNHLPAALRKMPFDCHLSLDNERKVLKLFPRLRSEIAAALYEALERFREDGRKTTLRLGDTEFSYLTVDFFRRLAQDAEEVRNPAASTMDWYTRGSLQEDKIKCL